MRYNVTNLSEKINMPDIFTKTNPQSSPPTTPAPVEPGHMNLFSAFVQNPKDVCFENEESDEQVLLFLRRHFITNIGWIIGTILLSLLPLLLPFVLPTIENSFSTIPKQFTEMFVLFYYLILLGFAFTSFLYWFYNVGIVTQKRIVNIQFADISYKNIQSTILKDVKDVEFTQSGFFQSLFNFGNVSVQIEASGVQFVFMRVPQPGKVADILLGLIENQTI